MFKKKALINQTTYPMSDILYQKIGIIPNVDHAIVKVIPPFIFDRYFGMCVCVIEFFCFHEISALLS